MAIIEFKSNILEGRYIRVPADIIDKIGDHRHVDVILKLSHDKVQNERDKEQVRIQAAFDEYRVKYPDDEVSLNDFKHVGILPGNGIEEYKDEVVYAIEAKYNDI